MLIISSEIGVTKQAEGSTNSTNNALSIHAWFILRQFGFRGVSVATFFFCFFYACCKAIRYLMAVDDEQRNDMVLHPGNQLSLRAKPSSRTRIKFSNNKKRVFPILSHGKHFVFVLVDGCVLALVLAC